MIVEPEPVFERSLSLPLGYVFVARVRPKTVARTTLRLLPWAAYAMLPTGRRARVALWAARKFTPLVKRKIVRG